MGAGEPRRASSPVAAPRATARPDAAPVAPDLQRPDLQPPDLQPSGWADPRSPLPGLALARAATVALGGLCVPVVAVAWLVEGTPGALGALVGLGLVGVLFGAAALVHAWAARLQPTTQLAVMAGGVGVRLLTYLLAVESLRGVEGLHRPSLAIATAIALAVTLGYELWLVARTPAFFWVHPTLNDVK